MAPTGAERHRREGRTADRAGASESNAFVGLDSRKQRGRFAEMMLVGQSPPLRISSENVPHLTAIRPSRLANAIGERLHRLRRVYRRIPVEPAIC
jgi:hypothetical protein